MTTFYSPLRGKVEEHKPAILIIDDQPLNLKVLSDYLIAHGLAILVAEDGESGLERARYAQPDLIILDVRLPGIDGIETCRRLKADPTTQTIPVLFMTVATSIEDKLRGFEVGGVDYISKPIQQAELLARVTTHIQIREQAKRLQQQAETLAQANQRLGQEIIERQQIEAELRQHRAHLEEYVAERTAELTQANAQLTAEIADRKRAELAMAESQALLSAVVESTADMIWSVDPERFGLLTWNHALQDYFMQGRSIALAVGMRPEELFPPGSEYVQRWRELYQRALLTGSYTMDYKVSVGERWLQLTFNLLEQQGRIFGISVFGKDITERKRAEADLARYHAHLEERVAARTAELTQTNRQLEAEIGERRRAEVALRVSETRFRDAFQHSAIGMALVSPEGQWLQVNAQVCAMLGYSEDELLTKTFQDVTHPDDLDLDLNYMHQMLAGEIETYTMEKRYFHKNGTIIWGVLAVSLVRDVVGTPLYFISQIEDITVRKQAEAALRESEAKYRLLAENTTDVIWMTDTAFRFTYISPSIMGLRGLTPEEALQETVQDTMPPHSLARVQQVIQEALAAQAAGQRNTIAQYEIEQYHKNGSLIWVEIVSKTLYDADGHKIGHLGISRNITERKRIESALRESENRLRTIFETSHAGIFMVNPQGMITFANQRMADMLKCSLTDLIGSAYPDHIHPDERAIGDQKMRQLIAGEIQSVSLERHYCCADGSDFWGLLNGRRLEDDHGQLISLVGILADITERRQIEAALRESEAKYRALYEEAAIGIFHSTAEGRFMDVNPALARMLGYASPQEVVDSIYSIPEQIYVTPPRHREILTQVLAQSQAITVENRYRRKDGTEWDAYLHVRHVCDQHGRPLYLEGFVEDITERKRAETALRESEERFAAVMNSMQTLMYVADLNTHELLFVNQYTRTHYQAREGQRCWETLQAGQNGQCPFCTNAHLMADGVPTGIYTWEFQNTRTGRWYYLQDQAIRWTDGRWVRLETATDITELKQIQADLQQAKAAAEAANQAKSVFLANMSHELRTPLNAVLGFTKLMASDANLTEAQRENLGIVGRSGEHLLTLINDVLEMSKIEAGRVELHTEGFDLHAMLRGLEEMFRLRAGQKGLSLTLELAPDVPQYIQADAGKLRQILSNLLSNAVKFTPAGSVALRVRSEELGVRSEELGVRSEELGVRSEELGTLRLADPNSQLLTRNSQLATPNSRLVFEVEDTGVGIAPEEMGTLFNAFVQTSSGRKAGEGTGLGLPISHEYVRMMGGELHVSNAPGRGSLFQFDLPLASLPIESLYETPRAAPYEMKGNDALPSVNDADLHAALTRQPAAWRNMLRQAAVEGDSEWLTHLVSQIQSTAPALAERLLAWVDNFEHPKILEMLDNF